MTSIEVLVGREYGNYNSPISEDDDDNEGNEKKRKKSDKQEDKTKTKREYTAYKYSNNGKGPLYEAVIVARQPTFLKYENGEVKSVQYVEDSSRIIKPPDPEEYAYEPYEFANIEEVQSYLENAERESTGSLYSKAKSIVQNYNDQDQNITILLAADIVWSYFQDIFPTTHYINIVGENDTGKSSLGYTFEYIGYRPVRGIGISAANYYRTLGTEEPGQCTIIEDEGDRIDQDPEKMGILKAGYELMSKVPKINMNTFDQKPKWYYAYCLKIIIAEKSLDQYKAKGLVDRTFIFHCKPGRTKHRYSIKEVINNRNNNNHSKQQLYNELVNFRKLMLCYRLRHYSDQIKDIQTGLKNRDQELCGPLLQLFYSSKQALSDVISALTIFLEEKKERKAFGLEASLYPLIVNLISKSGYELTVNQIWSEIIDNIEGEYYDERHNQYQTDEFGILYKNTITRLIVDKFGSGRKKKKTGNAIIFSKEKLHRFAEAYATKVDIRIALAEEVRNGSGGCSGGILEYLSNNQLNDSSNNYNNLNENTLKTANNDKNSTTTSRFKQGQNSQNTYTHLLESPQHPQHPQLPPTISNNSNSSAAIVSNGDVSTAYSNRRSIYRIGRTDNWACRRCSLRGDKWFMRQHNCRGQ